MLYFDASFLVPYFTAEAKSKAIEGFFASPPSREIAVSHWTSTEFHSAIGVKLRTGELPAALRQPVIERYENLVAEHFEFLPVKTGDFDLAAGYLAEWKLGLRTGDALHLAIARNHSVKCLYSLDRRVLKAAQYFGIAARAV